jgi:hypothetical protein
MLTAPMTVGTSDYLNGGQVSELQTFLVRDGVLSSAYITGYYGSLTASAVAQFQASRGIAPVGVVGPATRAAIEQVSCGTSGVGYVSPTQPINPGGPIIINNGNGYSNGSTYEYGYQRPDLNSLSVNYNGSSAIITIQGYGFDPTNNTVLFGNISIGGISSNGSVLSFTVPSVAPGNYNIYVTDSRGTSNTLAYTVGSNTNNGNCYLLNGSYQCNCITPVYNTNTNYSYNNNTCGNNSGQSVVLTSINGSGTVGAAVTIYGSGFTANNNTVYLGSSVISNTYSSNGTSLTFTIPSISYNNGGTYSLYVTNGNGVPSNTIQFNVTGSSYNNGQIYISALSPASGSVGTQIAIQGSGFSSVGNTVHFGVGGATNVNSYNGNTIYFNVPSSIGPCNVSNGSICAQYLQQVTSGSYPIYVTNQNGTTSNTLNFQVF